MGKKYYAVKKGVVPGIYTQWEQCKSMVNGYPGAEYKSFTTIEEADEYMNPAKKTRKFNTEKNMEEMPSIYAFVDGSFNETTGRYGYGGFLIHNGKRETLQGSGQNEDLASMRNVSGEIFGCMAAVKRAIDLKLPCIMIYYDYLGIEMWATGKWKRNKKGTINYYEFMQKAKNYIRIEFKKVKGHSGVAGNEEADRLAKKAVGIL